jgi:ABC-2 type transport system permease protein
MTDTLHQPLEETVVAPPHTRTGADSVSQSNELHRVIALTWTLALTDWKLRFYGSALGYVWTLAKPFAFFGVLYVVFTQIANLGAGVPHYGAYILFAMVLFNFFAEVTVASVTALTTRESLLRKMYFPPIVVPLSVAVTGLLNLGMTLVAVFIFAIINGVDPQWTWLTLPLLVAMLATFSLGLGMLLSVLYVRFRDIAPIWDVFSQIMFYASAVLYVITSVPDNLKTILLSNPVAAINTEMRRLIIDPSAPSLTTEMPDGKWLIPVILIIVSFVLGLWMFQRDSPRVAENL